MEVRGGREGTPLSAALKRRRVSEGLMTPALAEGEFVNAEDQEVYVNTYGRANLLRREYVEASEAKDVVIEEQRGELSSLRQRVSILESEKASTKAKLMALEQARQTKSLRERTESELGGSDGAGRSKVGDGSDSRGSDSAALELAREQQAKLRLLVDSKISRIADLEEAVATLERSKETEAAEKKAAVGEVERLKAEIVTLVMDSEGKRLAESRAATLEVHLKEVRAAQSQTEVRLAEALGEVEVERKKALDAEKAALNLQRKLVDASSSAEPVTGLELQVEQLEKELKSQVAEISSARALRGKLESTEVLKEKLAQAVARAARAEGVLASASASHVETTVDQSDLQSWKTVMGEKFGQDASPYDVLQNVSKLEKSVLQLTEECGRTKAESKQALRSREDLERNCKSLSEEKESLKEHINEMKITALRHDRKISLLQKERDGLKRIIASYDEEELSLRPADGAGAADGTGHNSALRVKELEELLQLQKAQAAKHEAELQAMAEKCEDLMNQNESHRAEARAMKDSLSALESEKVMMTRELAVTGQELNHLKAEHNSRILHLASNPEEKARRDHVNGLVAEISTLKETLQKSGRDVAEATVAGLQKQLDSLSKRESRLKSAFQERISLFIDACYSIFGYRIDMTTENKMTKFILRPMHEEKESLYLTFKYDSGAAELVPTEYSETMQREVDTFIGRYKTIPAFTANLTMDIFNKQTQC
ncbi:mitotic spindle checkpoint protein MAD1 [Chloropicon primus]|nr:mitotic spindle checkpoint protein MAD1 [Chloropicon primus]